MNPLKLSVRTRTHRGMTVWEVRSPAGLFLGAWADRVTALNYARRVAEQTAYEVQFNRVIAQGWGANR